MKKRIISLLMAAVFSLTLLSGCGKDKDDTAKNQTEANASSEAENSEGETSEESNTLIVATNPGVHEEILTRAAEILERKGITIEIDPYNDYVTPNFLLDAGEVDANYFQHEAFLNDFNLRQDMNLVSVCSVHFEPLGIYPGQKKSLSELKEGDIILIPEDRTNMGRALLLLQNIDLITLKDNGTEDNYSLSDISKNPYGLKIVPMEASRIPTESANAALLVINGNYARNAFLDVTKDSLAYENADSPDVKPYWNVVAVKAGNENDKRITSLAEVLMSDEIKTFINETYNGAAVAGQ